MSVTTWNDVECVSDAGAVLGEGPLWDADDALLWWVDIERGEVHALDPRGVREQVYPVGQPVGAIARRVGGGVVCAVRDGFGALDTASGDFTLLAGVGEDDPGTRMNDGKCDRHGRFWAGTMAFDMRRGAGALYRLDPDHRVRTIFDGVSISNGLAWNADDTTMYYIDTLTYGIDALDYDPETGDVSNRRRFIEIDPQDGAPDGMTIDAEDHLWVALFGGACVHRYAPDGSLAGIVRLPPRQVTSCAFGGEDLTELFVTTASNGVPEPDARAQQAGGVFRCRPGVRGVPAIRFGG